LIERTKDLAEKLDSAQVATEQAAVRESLKDAEIATLTQRTRDVENALQKERHERDLLSDQIATIQKARATEEMRKEGEIQDRARRRKRIVFTTRHLLLLALTIVLALIASFALIHVPRLRTNSGISPLVQLPYWELIVLSLSILLIFFVWLADLHIRRDSEIYHWHPARQFHHFKKWLFGFIIGVWAIASGILDYFITKGK
jgi:membrane glycosyltransferase